MTRIAPSVLLFLATLARVSAAPEAATVTPEPYGRTRSGEVVEKITLKNRQGMTAEILTYGAIIHRLTAPDREGRWGNVVLQGKSLEDYEGGFAGAAAVIGRVVNRIAGARFTLDGKTYPLKANEGRNTIHGGPQGFAQKVWTRSTTPAGSNEAQVKLTLQSPDGDEGFPGALTVSVIYSLTDANELKLDYEAHTDQPTIVNLTNHAYFNLAGSGKALDHVLEIPAEAYTPTDAELLPTGEILPVEGTPLDFRKPVRVGGRIDQLQPKRGGYDHNFVLEKGPAMKRAARLEDPATGRVLEVLTTQPAVQLYTGNHLGNTAVCLETQGFPDAIHHPEFPSIVVRPGTPFQQSTIYRFRTREEGRK